MMADYDVAIAGAGLGGLAASIFLRRAGLSVVCVEPDPFPRARVGESLDWSAPRLLEALGLPREFLIDEKIATYKRNIQISPLGGRTWKAQPRNWFRNPPIRFEIVTLHVDRVELDRRLHKLAADTGAEFVWDRVDKIETNGERVTGFRTAGGRRVTARWFLDNSGQTRLFAKAFQISKVEYGRRKVCLWTYFECAPRNQGTSFYADMMNDDYLTWIWEIPISPRVLSIGCVMPAEKMKEHRQTGADIEAVLRTELEKYPALTELLEESGTLEISRCSYQNYVSQKTCGPNWIMLGEAASLADPLTANGVTAAFRHGQESARLIKAAGRRSELSRMQRTLYNSRVRHMGHAFNHSIETSIYDWPIRKGLGAKPAQEIYTAFSYMINSLYTRITPEGWVTTRLFQGLLYGVAAWMETWAFVGRIATRLRRMSRERPRLTGNSGSGTLRSKYEA